MKEIYVRTLTGIVFLIVVIGSILLDPLAFFVVFSVFTFIGLKEFYKLARLSPNNKATPEYYLFGILIYAIVGLSGLGYIDIRYSAIIFVIFFIQIARELFRKNNPQWKNIAAILTGYIYISIPFGLMNSLFYSGAVGQPRIEILLGMFVIIWTSDVFAYLAGSMFGKHKLMERISPKKTWEGSIGGLFFSLIAAYILSLLVPQLSLVEWMILTIIIVISGTLGDLVESLLKRNADVKDSGTIFPGHGGVLDRFDAVIFATPMVFVYINLI
ncbi:MAG: CDP-archaeol synthase [Bacteroidetes bacterium]|nr:CDP-archaeol synthase [Bacteroidota bacterium]MBL6944805.1 CDP-archaeol synthase [Bacteroidales bacterium]